MKFRMWSSKRRPHDPSAESFETLFETVLASPRAARSVMQECDGDPSNFDGYSLRQLSGIPHVGDASAARVAAVLAIHAKMAAPLVAEIERLQAEVERLQAELKAAQKQQAA